LSYSAKGGILDTDLTSFCGPPPRFPSFERLNSVNSNRTVVVCR
jgi:hypothetical protein